MATHPTLGTLGVAFAASYEASGRSPAIRKGCGDAIAQLELWLGGQGRSTDVAEITTG